MTRNIIVSKGHRETRIAIVEDGKLAEIFVERDKQIVGSIYKCKVETVISGIDAAFVNIGEQKNAFLYAGDILNNFEFEETKKTKKNTKIQSINNLIKEGQELLVQVIKAPIGTKGARVTTKINFPGRYLVVIPNNDMIGISKRIQETERKRLKQIIEDIKPKNYGIIVRTEAEGISKKDLEHDIKLMLKIYEDIEQKAKNMHAPALVYKELSILYQAIRDQLTSEVSNMYIDNLEDYKKAITIADFFDSKLKGKIKHYKFKEPIFEHFGLELQYKQLFKRKVWLPGGGNICIDHAEAMTVIDVNSGKFTGNKKLDDTVFVTNIEAAKEIARQMRLRNLSGIIMVDFIDMDTDDRKEELLEYLRENVKYDRTKTNIVDITSLGLVEITRKKSRQNYESIFYSECPCCHGRGTIESPEPGYTPYGGKVTFGVRL